MAKILLAEDSADIAQLMSLMLQKDGHSVDVACDGLEAIRLLDGGQDYDVIITDLIMPKLDGVGLIRHVRESGCNVPVIVMSGGGVTLSSTDALDSVKVLAFAVMEKPVDCSDLSTKIEAAMVLRSMR